MKDKVQRKVKNYLMPHVQEDDTRVVIPYYYMGRMYKVLSKKDHGMGVHNHKLFILFSAIADDSIDVKSEVLEVMGPHKDFHGITITPEDMGYRSLVIRSNKGTFQFKSNEPIVFNFVENLDSNFIIPVDRDNLSVSESESDDNTESENESVKGNGEQDVNENMENPLNISFDSFKDEQVVNHITSNNGLCIDPPMVLREHCRQCSTDSIKIFTCDHLAMFMHVS
jgi:hypothetical protein